MSRTWTLAALVLYTLACGGGPPPTTGSPSSTVEADRPDSSEDHQWGGPEIAVGRQGWCASNADGEVHCSPETGIVIDGRGYHSLVVGGSPEVPTYLCALDSSNAVVCTGGSGQPTGTFSRLVGSYLTVCGLSDDGTVDCGDTELVPSGAEPLLDLSTFSTNRACGIFTDGKVKCWENGKTSTRDLERPREAGFDGIATGGGGGCASRDGKWTCWGDFGQAPEDRDLRWVSICKYQACGLDSAGRAVCWGKASTPPMDEFVALDCYLDYCGLRADGSVSCWEPYEYPEDTESPE